MALSIYIPIDREWAFQLFQNLHSLQLCQSFHASLPYRLVVASNGHLLSLVTNEIGWLDIFISHFLLHEVLVQLSHPMFYWVYLFLLTCKNSFYVLDIYILYQLYVPGIGVFIAVLLVKNWKQLICPAVAEWINKLWQILTMEYYIFPI